MDLLDDFLSLDHTSLKICGVTTAFDARELVKLSVDALGVNFWPKSKRYISADDAAPWLHECAGKILRVGVFVNEDYSGIKAIYERGLIDTVQLHGDESAAMMAQLLTDNIPVIKALGVKNSSDLEAVADFMEARAILLDTAAPGVYGGTGEIFDWSLALECKRRWPMQPLILAGGITPLNVSDAQQSVKPSALDVASGAELSPGVKDFTKVKKLLVGLSGLSGGR